MSNSLRKWQEDVVDRYKRLYEPNFLMVSCPGSGKTTAALAIAKVLIDEGSVKRVVVVVHTRYLKGQWTKAAAVMGMQLKRDYQSNAFGKESVDFIGMTVTYQQVASQRELFRKHCVDPTLVIFDEIHHAGESETWGESLSVAFDKAERRLLLSGTPFRTDGQPMPFVRYENGQCKPDYLYGYQDALDANIVPHVFFPHHDGEQGWARGSELFAARFDDEVGDTEESDRLRTSLMPTAGLMCAMASDGVAKLNELGDKNAGGLVLCIDQQHARDLASQFPEAVVAVSDDDDSDEKIRLFASGMFRWLLTVRKVCEGVDIPRLRVLVYATTTANSRGFFMQAAGRLMRGDPSREQWMIIPSDKRLKNYAQEMQEASDESLRSSVEVVLGNGSSDATSIFMPLSSDGKCEGVIINGQVYEPAVIEKAEAWKRSTNCDVPLCEIASLIATCSGVSVASVESDQPDINDVLKQRRSLAQKLLNRFARSSGRTHKDIGKELGKMHSYVKEASLEQLDARIKTLGDWISG